MTWKQQKSTAIQSFHIFNGDPGLIWRCNVNQISWHVAAAKLLRITCETAVISSAYAKNIMCLTSILIHSPSSNSTVCRVSFSIRGQFIVCICILKYDVLVTINIHIRRWQENWSKVPIFFNKAFLFCSYSCHTAFDQFPEFFYGEFIEQHHRKLIYCYIFHPQAYAARYCSSHS